MDRRLRRHQGWVTFQTKQGVRAGRELLHPAYASAKWMRVVVRNLDGTSSIILRDIVRDQVRRLNRVDPLEVRASYIEVAKLREETIRLFTELNMGKHPGAIPASDSSSPQPEPTQGEQGMT